MNVCPGEGVAYDSYYNETDRVIKKMKKIARKERQHSDDESNNNFTQDPLPPMQKKRPNKCSAPSSDSNDSCGEEAVEGPSMGKGGDKKPKLAKKKKAKKMEKENDLVRSSRK